jgi:hypothetical protein
MTYYPFVFEAAPVIGVTMGWFYRSRQKIRFGEYRKFAELLSLCLCTYSALALSVMSELRAGRDPEPVVLGSNLFLAHVLIASVAFLLALFGKGKVRTATLIAAAFSAALWYIYNARILD